MKKLLISSLILPVFFFACKKEPNYSKAGVSLPTVSNLVLQNLDSARVRLNWQNPTNIPAEMEQPLGINIQVNEVQGPTRSISVAVVDLASAPNTYTYILPDSAKTYHFIVKIFGATKSKDPNYSTTIYSLGQTVEYKK